MKFNRIDNKLTVIGYISAHACVTNVGLKINNNNLFFKIPSSEIHFN